MCAGRLKRVFLFPWKWGRKGRGTRSRISLNPDRISQGGAISSDRGWYDKRLVRSDRTTWGKNDEHSRPYAAHEHFRELPFYINTWSPSRKYNTFSFFLCRALWTRIILRRLLTMCASPLRAHVASYATHVYCHVCSASTPPSWSKFNE